MNILEKKTIIVKKQENKFITSTDFKLLGLSFGLIERILMK